MKYISFRRNRIKLDRLHYYIPLKAILDTENILSDYPSFKDPHEMIVYWAGTRIANKCTVKKVIAPEAKTSSGSVVVSHEANFHFVKILSGSSLVQIAQVHTHPSSWIGHSPGDSAHASFKIKGLLSIVVPFYCVNGMLPLSKCGIHLFDGEEFARVSIKFINGHFHILNDKESVLDDLREQCSQ